MAADTEPTIEPTTTASDEAPQVSPPTADVTSPTAGTPDLGGTAANDTAANDTAASDTEPSTGEGAAEGTPARKPAKRTARKTTKRATKKAAESPTDAPTQSTAETPAQAPVAEPAPTGSEEVAAAPAEPDEESASAESDEDAAAITVPSLGLLFQAPDLTTVPARRSRRASAPSGPPVEHPRDSVPQDSSAAASAGHDGTVPTAAAPDQGAADEATADEATGDEGALEQAESRSADRTSGRAARRSTRGRRGTRAQQDALPEDDAQAGPDTPQMTSATGSEADTGGAAGSLDHTPGADADADSTSEDAGTDDSGDEGTGRGRRRRRGGKGRRAKSDETGTDDAQDSDERGQGTDRGSDADTGTRRASRSAERDQDTDGEGGDGEPADSEQVEGSESSSSRRRTRRRRRSGASGGTDDEPGVTTRVRDRRDEVTGVRGSTRLEAKKQRRREGREAGRRRQIITEAEFLARRESVDRVMVVRAKGGHTQIGVLEDGVLVEHYIDREQTQSMAGNIYLGRVQNVLPSMEAAFVDIGKGRNAVLYAGEVNWDAAGLEQNQPKRIENALESGQAVLVQVTKDPIGHKGARLTSQISLPGRFLVYVPNSSMTGISRKLPDTERARLKNILREVVPADAGVIVRTAAEGASEEELRADVERLTATWEQIKADAEAGAAGGRKAKGKAAPALLHGEPDMTVKVIRDIFNEDFASLVVEGEEAWAQVSSYLESVAPDLAGRASRWTSEEDLFAHYRVDEQIAKAMDRKVWLPSGGSLVIDRTEAMTVIDVNTGKFIGSGGNLEETVTKNNIEAAEEIVRQLRLRDIGGIIVIDFIDMVLESNRDLVVRRLLECLGRDRTKHQVAEVTSLGLVQMTRKRVGSGLIEVFSETCTACSGRGFIIHADPVERSGADNGGQGHSHGSSGGSGSGSQHGSNGGAGQAASSRSRRSRKGAETQPVAVLPPVPTANGGRTPAQIAAAAHAAAMKTAALADELGAAPAAERTDEAAEAAERAHAEAVLAQVVQSQLGSELGVGTESTSSHAPSSETASETATEASAESTSSPEPSSESVSESASATASDTGSDAGSETAAEGPAAAAPRRGGRRRHGRVVAPAGPPTGDV